MRLDHRLKLQLCGGSGVVRPAEAPCGSTSSVHVTEGGSGLCECVRGRPPRATGSRENSNEAIRTSSLFPGVSPSAQPSASCQDPPHTHTLFQTRWKARSAGVWEWKLQTFFISCEGDCSDSSENMRSGYGRYLLLGSSETRGEAGGVSASSSKQLHGLDACTTQNGKLTFSS